MFQECSQRLEEDKSNDMATKEYILITCLVILIGVNFAVFNVRSSFEGSAGEFSTQNVKDQQMGVVEALNSTSIIAPITGTITTGRILAGILLWSFGLLPVWLDLILTIVRLIALAMIIAIIRGS